MEVFVRVTVSEISLDMLDAFCTLFNHESPCLYSSCCRKLQGKRICLFKWQHNQGELIFPRKMEGKCFHGPLKCFMFFLFILVGCLIQ